MSSTLDQAALPSERMTAYPLSRQEAACHKWAIRMKVQLAKYGVAAVLTTALRELDELDDRARVASEKVYGTLLDDKGCLRKQPALRGQLLRMLEQAPRVQFHGGRLFAMFKQGLPFIPVAPEVYDADQAQLQSCDGIMEAGPRGAHRRGGRVP